MSSRAIVTGGAGFIGSHVVDALLADGYEVTVIDNLSSGDAARVADAAKLVELDIVDALALDALVTEVKPRAIFHLAAQSSVVVSVENPGLDCEVNVRGTLNVLEAAGRWMRRPRAAFRPRWGGRRGVAPRLCFPLRGGGGCGPPPRRCPPPRIAS